MFELTTPFRTKSESLLGFWDKVRNIDDVTEDVHEDDCLCLRRHGRRHLLRVDEECLGIDVHEHR